MPMKLSQLSIITAPGSREYYLYRVNSSRSASPLGPTEFPTSGGRIGLSSCQQEYA